MQTHEKSRRGPRSGFVARLRRDLRPRASFRPCHLLHLLTCLASIGLAAPATSTAQSNAEPAAAGGSTQAQAEGREKVEFTSMNLPSPISQGADATAARRVFRTFISDRPHYEMKAFQMPSVEGAAMDSAPLMGIAAGQPPHVIYVNFRQSSSYVNHGFLAPMEVLLARLQSDNERVRQTDEAGQWLVDPTAEEIEAAKEKIRERVVDRVWPVVHRRADVDKEGVPQGEHVWSLPTSTLVRALMYRKDVFREAGLNPEQPPETWEEFLQAARAINKLPGKTGFAIPGGPNISWAVYSFMVSNNVRYMERNEQGEWQAAFNTPEAAESIYYVLRLAKQPYPADDPKYTGAALVSPNRQDLQRRWNNGEIGMSSSYLEQDQISSVNPELVGLAPMPYPGDGTPSGELNARMLGVYAGGSPEQQLASMDYIWFVTGDRAEEIRTRTMVEFGFGKFLNPALLRKYGYEDVLRKIPEGWRNTFETAIENGVPEPYGKNTQFIYQKVSAPINWALNSRDAEGLLELPENLAKAKIKEQLDDAADRVNRFMLGKLTPEQWRTRRWVGGTALVLVLIAFVAALTYVWRAFTKADAAKSIGQPRKVRKFWKAYLLMAPALVILIFWQYGPVIMGLPLALFDFELVVESQFVGIDNFATVLYDSRFWESLGRTFYYVLLVVGLGFWPPIFVAILLDEVPTATAKYTFRTIFYLPAIVSGVIMVFLWLQLYQPDEDGFLNQILMSVNSLDPISATILKWVLLGCWLALIGMLIAFAMKLREISMLMRGLIFAFALALAAATLWPLVEAYGGPSDVQLEALRIRAEQAGQAFNPNQYRGFSAVLGKLSGLVGRWDVEPFRWVQDPGLAMLCVVIPGIWAGAGPGCIIYLAALKTVPEELVEASTIDGAGIIQKIAYITLPRIKFLILIQFVGAVVSAFKGGTNFILAMTGGGPNGATRVLGMDIFERSFMELQYGVGAAMAWLLGALVIALTAYQLKRLSRAEFRTADTAKEGPEGAAAK